MKKEEINILIVDDDASVRAALAKAVQRHGFKATEATRGDEALKMVRIKAAQAAIIDCMLPGINGVDLVGQLRKAGLNKAPVIMTSGVFRDKGFAADAIKKTKAKTFLQKPINLKDLIEELDNALVELIDEPKLPLHALMSRPFASERERKKAVDQVEEISGYDLPFIMSIFMDSKASGHLNLFSDTGEIYGISFKEGCITKVDSGETRRFILDLVVNRNYVADEDLTAAPDEIRRGDVLHNLVDNSMVSPHVVPVILSEQMVKEIYEMVSSQTLQMNFVPDDSVDEPATVDGGLLTQVFHDLIDKTIPLPWLHEFYEPWNDHPIRLGPQFRESHEILKMPLANKLPGLVELLKEEPTVLEVLEKSGLESDCFYRILHLLAIRRLIVFDESKRSLGSGAHLERLKSIYEQIKEKNSFEVMHFFGAKKTPSAAEVEKIYKEFAKANHPDKLASSTSAELKDIAHKVFSIVTEAHGNLTDEGRRAQYENKIKSAEAESQLRAESLFFKGKELLEKGKTMEALQLLEESSEKHPSVETDLYLIWAKMKMAGTTQVDPAIISKANQVFENYPTSQRRTAPFQFVQGLYHRATGEIEAAHAAFEKALSFDERFIAARREMVALGEVGGGGTKPNILRDDLGTVINFYLNKKSS